MGRLETLALAYKLPEILSCLNPKASCSDWRWPSHCYLQTSLPAEAAEVAAAVVVDEGAADSVVVAPVADIAAAGIAAAPALLAPQ